MSEKLSLTCNNFLENINLAFGNLRNEPDFADVILACEDGQQIKAHKVILAFSSPLFKNMLKKMEHPYPLIYMRGIKYEVLLALIDFLYLGETTILDGSLEPFLALAEELKLTWSIEKEENVAGEAFSNFADPLLEHSNIKLEDFDQRTEHKISGFEPEKEDQTLLRDLKELSERVKSVMVKSQNRISNGGEHAHICTVCGKEGKMSNIKEHIEANHLKGIALPCNTCEKVFKTRRSMMRHSCPSKERLGGKFG